MFLYILRDIWQVQADKIHHIKNVLEIVWRHVPARSYVLYKTYLWPSEGSRSWSSTMLVLDFLCTLGLAALLTFSEDVAVSNQI